MSASVLCAVDIHSTATCITLAVGAGQHVMTEVERELGKRLAGVHEAGTWRQHAPMSGDDTVCIPSIRP